MENKARLNSIIDDALKVITNPVAFYRGMEKTGGFIDPVIFVVVMAAVAGIIISLLSMFGAGFVGGMAAGIGAIIIFPIMALIGSFIGAAILFVIWKLMGSGESYETAYRCVAYSTAVFPITSVLGMVPYIGSVAGIVWGIYLMVTASIEVHKLAPKTVYIVFGILGALLVLSNLSGERAARNMASGFEDMGKQFEDLGKQMEKPGDMTPGDAGKAVGEFIKGLEEATKGTQSE